MKIELDDNTTTILMGLIAMSPIILICLAAVLWAIAAIIILK